MKSFIEFLLESPQKMKGNAPFEELSYEMISNKSKRIVEIDFDLVEKNWLESASLRKYFKRALSSVTRFYSF
jgi:hypothetical protein